MPVKKRVRGKIWNGGRGGKGENNIENLSRMINASRAFRNLPPEMTMGRRYDDGSGEDPAAVK